MKKYKCVIIEDEPLAVKVIKGYLERLQNLELIGSFDSPIKAYDMVISGNVDLLFLDIEMPDLSGIEFIKSIQNPPAVILTTAYRDYALESYDIGAVDYLLKPISFSRFFKAINKFQGLQKGTASTDNAVNSGQTRGSIFVYSNKKNVKVYFDNILYLESIKDYIRVHTTEGNLITKDTISHYENTLPGNFMRIHRSYIVNTDKLTAFTQHDVEIGSKEIPIGVSYKKRVFEDLKNRS